MAPVLCFGELLWDELPAGPRLGGAPANVAYHLAQLGVAVRLVSAVGADPRGDEALARLAAAGVDVALVARQAELPTGRVRVQLAADGPHYRIEEGVAWDDIAFAPVLREAATAASALVFGTLAQRTAPNRATLSALLAAAGTAVKVCDLNFRSPFIAAAAVADSLRRADIVKLNADELAALPDLLALPAGAEFPQRLLAEFNLRRIVITRGELGCWILDAAGRVEAAAPAASVADSVGAGDAFTAVLVYGELQGWSPARIARAACAAGAFVASQPGAMPTWPPALRERLLAD